MSIPAKDLFKDLNKNTTAVPLQTPAADASNVSKAGKTVDASKAVNNNTALIEDAFKNFNDAGQLKFDVDSALNQLNLKAINNTAYEQSLTNFKSDVSKNLKSASASKEIPNVSSVAFENARKAAVKFEADVKKAMANFGKVSEAHTFNADGYVINTNIPASYHLNGTLIDDVKGEVRKAYVANVTHFVKELYSSTKAVEGYVETLSKAITTDEYSFLGLLNSSTIAKTVPALTSINTTEANVDTLVAEFGL